MLPRLQKGVEMDKLGNEAEAHDVESLQEFPRGLTWTKSWNMRVRIFYLHAKPNIVQYLRRTG
jgi:hypothetical protein